MEKARILVVEDEGIIARDIEESLDAAGFDVIATEASGERAIERAGREKPDLVLMDIVLQGRMDGIEAAAEIRSRFGIPVIYLTAHADSAQMQRARLTEPHGYLIKPFDTKELRFTIDMALYKHEMELKLRESREWYRELVETAGAIPWEVDLATSTFSYIGPQVEKILGYPRESWVDIGFWAGILHPEDAAWAKDYCMAAVARGEDHDFEYRVRAADGRVLWLRDIVSIVKADDGTPVKLRGFMLDVTKRRQAEEEREKLIRQFREALDNIKTLKGLLPMCAWCKKIRDDSGYWQQVELYIQQHSDASFTHGMCPECRSRMEKELDAPRKKDEMP